MMRWRNTCRCLANSQRSRRSTVAVLVPQAVEQVLEVPKIPSRADPGITTEPTRGLTEAQSRPADMFTTADVPGRSAALDLCVGHPPMQPQPEGMRLQAAFDRKTSHTRRKIPTSSRIRPLVWTQSGVIRTLQHAADIASYRYGKLMSAKGPPAKMETRSSESPPPTKSSHRTSSLPNTSAREQWFLSGLIDGATSHWFPRRRRCRHKN